MTPELRPITKLTVASTTALFLLAAPLAVDWRTLDIDVVRAEAESDGGGNSGNGGGLGGAVGDAADAVGGAVEGAADAATDGVSDAVDGDSGSDESSSGSGSGEASTDSGSGDTSSGSGSADASGDAPAADGAAPADGASSGDSVADSGEAAETGDADAAPDVADTVSDAVAPAAEVADEVADAVSETAPAVATDAAIASSTTGSIAASSGSVGKAVTSRTRITVSVTTVRLRPTRGDGDDKHRLVGSSPIAATAIVELPPDDATAAAAAGIEPSAGPVLPAALSEATSAAAGCTADDGRQQGTQMSCLVAGSEREIGTRQIAYAPPDAAVDGGTPEAAIGSRPPAAPLDAKLAPSIDKLPKGPGVYDELYGLQQVEARRYADGDMPVLIVQGIVSNMSNGQRSVPPLLAIVQDDQGKELLRWTFRAEAETLGPGGSTGFRSEMFDPQSESAKVTIVFAAEQQAMP